MIDIVGFTERLRILLLYFLIFWVIGWITALVFWKEIAYLFLILGLIILFIGAIVYAIWELNQEDLPSLYREEFKKKWIFKIFGRTIEIGGCEIKNWKENWRLFFIVLTVTVSIFCFFILFPSARILTVDHYLFISIIAWIYLLGYWAYRNIYSGKDMKAARLLCRAKYEGTNFHSCMEKQIERCKRITGQEQAHMDSPGDLEYESCWVTEARLQAYVDVNYEKWRKRYEESREEKEREDELWERFLETS